MLVNFRMSRCMNPLLLILLIHFEIHKICHCIPILKQHKYHNWFYNFYVDAHVTLTCYLLNAFVSVALFLICDLCQSSRDCCGLVF